MSTLQSRLRAIEQEIHTLETATPRNSASVDRGELSVVDEGSIILESGGTVFFEEGGSAVSESYNIEDGTGWQIGTERRGTSIVVLSDVPSQDLDVRTANSSATYEKVALPSGETTVSIDTRSMAIVQIHYTSETKIRITVDGNDVHPTPIIKSRKEQWAYSYMNTHHRDTVISTDADNLEARLVLFTVNNVS